MHNYKIIISLTAVILSFVGYIPYIIDVLKKRTTPHVFTWLVWSLAVGVSTGLQIVGGAGVGSWTSICITVLCFFIFILSLRTGDRHVTFVDIVFLLLALTSLFLWLVVKEPTWSVILVVSTDVLGFAPTLRKSWNNPYSETLFTYELSTFRHILTIFALQRFNILTLLYPIVWVFANLIFSLILIFRRKVIRKQ
jgi:hypothetical protein